MSETTKSERLLEFKHIARHDADKAREYFMKNNVRASSKDPAAVQTAFISAATDLLSSYTGKTMQIAQDISTIIADIPNENVRTIMETAAINIGIKPAIL